MRMLSCPMDKKDILTYYGHCRNCNGIFAKETEGKAVQASLQ